MAAKSPVPFPLPMPNLDSWFKHLPFIVQSLRFLRITARKIGTEDRGK